MTSAAGSPQTKHPVTVGIRCMLHCDLVLETQEAKIRIGSRTFIGANTLISAAQEISIGNDVLISFGCLIFDHDSHPTGSDDRARDIEMWRQGLKDWSRVAIRPVSIGDRAWIGARAIILKGTRIGAGAIVGAGSVVTKDVPPGVVAAGSPARVIGRVEGEG